MLNLLQARCAHAQTVDPRRGKHRAAAAREFRWIRILLFLVKVDRDKPWPGLMFCNDACKAILKYHWNIILNQLNY